MIRVLHLLGELRPSGAEIMLEIASDMFLREGVESTILATGDNEGDFSTNLRAKSYSVFHIPYQGWWRLVSPVFLYRLYNFIRVNNYDVVHIHTERARFSLSLISKIALVKCIVTTVHHIFPPESSFKGYLAKIVKIVRRFLMRYVFGVLIVSNSRSGLKNELENYKSNNLLIPNWFDAVKYQPPKINEKRKARSRLNISEDTLVFVSLGGNWEYKNYDLILDAIGNQLSDDLDVLYLQVGPDVLGEPLQKKVETLNISTKVKLAGKVDDVLPYLWAADVYIMPSSIEGFGVAAVEAMGSGLAAILSDVPALNDFKEDTDEIYWVNTNVTDIANAISYFSSLQKNEIVEKGKKLSSVIRGKYGIDNGVRAYIDLYQNCRAKKKPNNL